MRTQSQKLDQSRGIVESDYGYPQNYRVKDINEQIDILCTIFPQLDRREVTIPSRLPEGAEGWFAIPRWEAISRGEKALLLELRNFLQRRYGYTNVYEEYKRWQQEHMVISQKLRKALEWYYNQQQHDILVIPAQLGRKYVGLSATQALSAMSGLEFPLGILEVSVLLLTHPERLSTANDLVLVAPGNGYFDGAQCYSAQCGLGSQGLIFSMRANNEFAPYKGVVSGFYLVI